jgi:hypothetical protein
MGLAATRLEQSAPTAIPRGLALSAYLYLAGLTLISLLPRHADGGPGALAYPLGVLLLIIAAGLMVPAWWQLGRERRVLSEASAGLAALAVGGLVLLGAAAIGDKRNAYPAIILGFWVSLAAVAAMAVFIPAAFRGILWVAESAPAASRAGRTGLALAMVPLATSVASAPHFYQDIGSPWASAAGLATVAFTAAGVLVILAVPQLPLRLVDRVPRLSGRALIVLATILAGLAGCQAVLPLPDRPGLYLERRSAAIDLIAPPGHPEILSEVDAWQRAYEGLAQRAGVPAARVAFRVTFEEVNEDRLRPLGNPMPYPDGVMLTLSQTPAVRLEAFRARAAQALARTAVVSYRRPNEAFQRWLLDRDAGRPLPEACQAVPDEVPLLIAERQGGLAAVRALIEEMRADPSVVVQQTRDAVWAAKVAAACASYSNEP